MLCDFELLQKRQLLPQIQFLCKGLTVKSKCKLSVNVNKIATLRNSRGGDLPSVLQCSADLIAYGAEGITVHPRPDERHIHRADVFDLAAQLKKINRSRASRQKIEFNIEGYPDFRYMKLIQQVHPDQATLVPDPPDVLTSNAGWQLERNEIFLRKILARLRRMGVRSSLFIDPFELSAPELQALDRLKPDRIELYTERYARDFGMRSHRSTLKRYQWAANSAAKLGIAVNAGHDLNSRNLREIIRAIPQIVEVSIGHALISEALYLGFHRTVQLYKSEIRRAR